MYDLQLRKLRRERKLNQKDVAEALHVSVKVYGAWEREDTALPLDAAVDLARFFGVTVDELAGDKPRVEYAAIDLTETERAVIAAMRDGEKEKGIRRDQGREGVA